MMESETPENNEPSARVLAMRTRLQEQSIQRGEPEKDWSFITDEFLNKVLAGVVKDLLWYDHVKVLFHRTVAVVTLVILSASLIVVLRSEAPTWVLAVWLTPLVMACLFSLPYITNHWSTIRGFFGLTQGEAMALVDDWIDRIRVEKQRESGEASAMGIVVGTPFRWIAIIFLFPIMAMELAGHQFAWYRRIRNSVGIYSQTVWYATFTCIAIFIGQHQRPKGEAFIASLVGIVLTQQLYSRFLTIPFGRYKGRIPLDIFRNRLSLSAVLREGALIVICFGAVFHALSHLEPGAFVQSGTLSDGLDVIDAMYLSSVTMTTVGYGDITPKSTAAKSLCMLEMVFSYCFSVLLIGTVLSLWQEKYLDRNRGDDSSSFHETDESG